MLPERTHLASECPAGGPSREAANAEWPLVHVRARGVLFFSGVIIEDARILDDCYLGIRSCRARIKNVGEAFFFEHRNGALTGALVCHTAGEVPSLVGGCG